MNSNVGIEKQSMPIIGKSLQGKQAKILVTTLKFRKRRYSLLVQRAKDCICCLVLAGVLKVSMHGPALKKICHYCSTVRPKASTFQLLNQLQFISGHLEVYSGALDLPIIARTIEFHKSYGLHSHPALCIWCPLELCSAQSMWRYVETLKSEQRKLQVPVNNSSSMQYISSRSQAFS